MANVPIAGEGFTFTLSLTSQTTGQILTNPTIAAGDFKVSTDGGALANLTNLPAVTPAASGIVEITLTAAEVGSEHFSVVAIDAAGDEWKPVYYHEVISNAQGGGSGATFTDGHIEMFIDEGSILTMEVTE